LGPEGDNNGMAFTKSRRRTEKGIVVVDDDGL
jgi:hypothetical protein